MNAIINFGLSDSYNAMKEQLKHQKKWQSLFTIGSITICLVLTQHSKFLNYSNVVLAQSTSNSSIDAAKIFRDAYENRYTWDKHFPGYTAVIEVSLGKENYKGNLTINSDLSVKVAGIDNQEARTLVENQLRMIVVHRRRVPFEVEHKNSTFQLGKTDKNGAVEIVEHGEKTDAYYKVFDNELKQVNRVLGNTAVTVDVLASEKTPSGYLATRYRTIFHQTEHSQALGEEDERDTYNKIGGYYLLSKAALRDVDFKQNQRTTAILNFTDIHLLVSSSS